MFKGFAIEAAAPAIAAGDAPFHLVEELSHRVLNEYAEAISILSLAGRRAACGDAQRAIEAAADRLRAHAESHRSLLPPLAGGRANLADTLSKVCSTFAKACLADNGVRLVLRSDDIYLSTERCWRVGLIIAELIRNAARHGLAGGEGLILVRAAKRSGCVSCGVCDSGQAETATSEGRGRRLIRSLATDLGGTVDWWFSSAGSLSQLQFSAHSDDPAAPSPSPIDLGHGGLSAAD